jgi:hypothetical protein
MSALAGMLAVMEPGAERVEPIQALDVRVLRALARHWDGRLKRPRFLGSVVVAAQLAELVLAGALEDDSDRPVVNVAVAIEDRLRAVRDRVGELPGCRWDQLFWRGGIDTEAAFAESVAWLIDRHVWEVERSGWRGRSVRYIDQSPATTTPTKVENVSQANDVLDSSGIMLAVLISLYRLGLGPEGQSFQNWLPARSIVDQPSLPDGKREALLNIVVGAQQPFNVTATQGDYVDGGG